MTSDTTSMNSTTTQTNTKDEARAAAQDVAGTAKEQATHVAGETRRQARQLWEQSRDELVQQSGQQQTRIAATLRDLGSELSSMVNGPEQGGNATALVREVGDHVSSAASWLEDKEPGDVLEELRDFARRRPGTFLLVAAGLGVLGGRLTRGAVADAHEPSDTGSAGPTTASAPGASVPNAGAAPFTDNGTTPYSGADTAYPADLSDTTMPTQGRDAGGLRPRHAEGEVYP